MKLKLTDREILKLQAGAARIEATDTETRGLVLRITPNGHKAFYFLKRISGKLERLKLGDYPDISVKQARDKIKILNAGILMGDNAAAKKRAAKAEPTFGDLLRQYVTEKRSRAGKGLAERTKSDYLKLLETHLKPIANMKISQVTKDQIRKLKIASDAQTNRARAVIGAVFTWAEAEDLIDTPNPAKALRTRLVKSRERFLLPDELPRFFEALEGSSMKDFFWILLLTGQRRRNVETMRWSDIDLNEGVWRIDGGEMKNGASMTVPLPAEAVQILKQRKASKLLNVAWVFPGRRSAVTGKVGPMAEPKTAWARVLKEAQIENLRIHDLRRTLGSWQARQGSSLQVIGKSLGHKSQQATQIYSRLDLDPVRTSVEGAVSAMLERRTKKAS